MTPPAAAVATAVARDGYAVVPGVLSPAEVAAAADALDEVFAAEDDIATDRGWRTDGWRVSYVLPAKHERFLDLCTHPGLLAIARAVLGDDCILAACNGLAMRPGGPGQSLHVDHDTPTPGTTTYLHLVCALDEFTEENGATRVVPGSHREPARGGPGAAQHAVALPAPAGAVIAYDGTLWHAGGANRTDRPRRALHAFFGRRWVARHWDFVASLPPAAAARLDDVGRHLLGFAPTTPWFDRRTRQVHGHGWD